MKRGLRSIANRHARKRLRELRTGRRWEANYCGFEAIDSELSALVIAGPPSLVDNAGRAVERMMLAGLQVLAIGRTDGGPFAAYSRVFALVVRAESVTDRMRRQSETLPKLEVLRRFG